jgi:hypothetical protein
MAKKISIRSLELLWPQEGQNAREAPAIPALLRLARAANELAKEIAPTRDGIRATAYALDDALAAFDFTE